MSKSLALSALPLFPLGTVLFPDGLLPLRIFEVRYLDMVKQCFKSGTPFGVVALTRGMETRQAGAGPETFHPVGTLARITHVETPQPGLLVIQCTGTERFQLRSSHQLGHGLWVGDAELIDADLPVTVPEDLQHAASALTRLMDTLREQDAAPDGLPIQEPYRLDDAGWLANRWCELLPLPVAMKQRLMTLDNPLVRLELIGDLLAQHHIAN
ncbi:MAG: peptidase [Rhodoferax sp.]|nr:peptidase [Rhodoferax sp.]